MNPDDTHPHLRLVGGKDFEEKKLDIPAQHRGILFSRVFYSQDPTSRLEFAFAREWSRINKKDCVLEMLLCLDGDDPRRESLPKTEREWEVANLVAATIVQFLPTQGGCSLLRNGFEGGGGGFKCRLPDYENYCS